MSQPQSIALADGQTTPVTHTFMRVPSSSPLIAAFKDGTTGMVAVARSTLTSVFRPAAKNNDGAKRIFTITVPEYDPATKLLVGSARVQISVLTPEALGASTLKDTVAYTKNFVSGAAFSNAVTNGDEIN